MVTAVLVWVGAVLGIGLLLLMALGPVIVEIDSWWYERRQSRKVTEKNAAKKTAEPHRVRELARV